MAILVGILFTQILILGLYRPKRLLLLFLVAPAFVDLLWEMSFFGLRFLEFAYGGMFLAAILVLIVSKKSTSISPRYLAKNYLFLYLAFFIPIIIAITEGNYNSVFDQLIKISFGLLSYLLVNYFIDRNEIPKVLKYVAFGAILSLVIFALQLILGIRTEYSEYTYGTGFYADEGTLSRKAVYVIILFFPIGGHTIFRKSLYSYLFTGFSLVTLMLSVSRNAILAALAVITIYVLLQKRFFTFAFVGLFFIGVFLSNETVRRGFYNKVEKENSYLQGGDVNYETLGSGRIGRWNDVLEEYQYANTFNKLFGRGKGIGPHGQFFDILRRGGLFSTFLFFTFFIKITLIAITSYRKDESIKINLYLIQFLVVFWVLSFAATPLWNFQLLSLIFTMFALTEKLRGQPLKLFNRK